MTSTQRTAKWLREFARDLGEMAKQAHDRDDMEQVVMHAMSRAVGFAEALEAVEPDLSRKAPSIWKTAA